MYNCCAHAHMYAWILSIASVRLKPTMDAWTYLISFLIDDIRLNIQTLFYQVTPNE